MANVEIALNHQHTASAAHMVAMLSVLEHARQPVSVHILGGKLSAAAQKVIEDGCRRTSAADLVFHDLEDVVPGNHLVGNWARVILARPYIPEIIDERVLYLGSRCAGKSISRETT